ncbi:hypothetical protein ILUMI_20701 [Ignelater luminosus]|uniref:Uncharacterized protein n=1 Tax=Ignelater luminosus TaxID=2038154 RepID=A0A8K0CDT8_IGNLU|nr:hypothetical protein ILUMI_20701 [Ignelater luminosus]
MATTRSETVNVPKFDGSNFQLWKFSVTILLKAEKLLTIVNGKDTEPEDKKSSEWTAWDTKNSRAQKSKKLLFVGYEGHSTNYRLWDPKKRRIEISCNVNFNESETLKIGKEKSTVTLNFGHYKNNEQRQEANTEGENVEYNSEEDTATSKDQVDEIDDDPDYEHHNFDTEEVEQRQLRDRGTLRRPDYFDAVAAYSSIFEPNSYEDAVKCEDSNKRHRAMDDEMNALKSNDTWTLVKLPENARVIDNKWVFQIYLAIYVDDGLLMSKSSSAIDELISELQQMFKITVNRDNTNLQIVGLQIEQNISEGTISIHQQAYTTKVLDKFKMTHAEPLSVPVEPGICLTSAPENGEGNLRQPYREAVGKIEATGYTDADYAGCVDTRKSTSGYIFVMANGPVTWKSQKQTVVAQSTTEAEYIALALGVREALWLRSFLQELSIEATTINIKVDNQSAIKLTQAQQLHSRTKHIDVKLHFVRDECEKGSISNINSHVVSKFRREVFGVRRTKSCFSRSPVDLTLEQTINADASNQLTYNLAAESISVRQRWALSHSVRAKIVSTVKEHVNLSQKDDTCHVLQKSRIKKDKESLQSIIETIRNTLNSFDESIDENVLFNISTGKATSPEVCDFLTNVKSKRQNSKLAANTSSKLPQTDKSTTDQNKKKCKHLDYSLEYDQQTSNDQMQRPPVKDLGINKEALFRKQASRKEWPKITTEWTPKLIERKTGRPKTGWKSEIDETAGSEWTKKAKDRELWKYTEKDFARQRED